MMNRFLLFSIALGVQMISIAQTTMRPTIVEGRIWNVVSIHPAETPGSVPYRQAITKTSVGDGALDFPILMS